MAKAMRRRYFLLLLTLGGGLIVFIYSAISPPLYEANVQIVLSGVGPKSPLIKDYESLAHYVNEQYGVLQSDRVLNAVIDELHLRISKRFMVDDPAAILKKSFKIRHTPGTNLIDIDVVMDNPSLALRIATVLAEQYVASVHKVNFHLSEEARKWLTQTSDLVADIKSKEEALIAFDNNNNRETIKLTADTVQGSLRSLNEDKTRRIYSLNKIQNEIELLKAAVGKDDLDTAFSVLSGDHLLYNLKRKIFDAESELQDTKKTRGDKDPEVAALEKKLKDLKAEAKDSVNKDIGDKEAEENSLKEQIEIINRKISDNNGSLAALKKKESDYDALSRELETSRDLYNAALKQIEDKGMPVVEVEGVIVPEEEAILSPVSPRTGLNTLFGFLAGFMLSIIIIFLPRIKGFKPKK